MVQILNPQYYISDHWMVVAKHLLEPAKCHYRYFKGHTALPFTMPYGLMPKMDFLFQQVVGQTPDPPRRDDPARKPWMSEETSRFGRLVASLTRLKATARRNHAAFSDNARLASKRIAIARLDYHGAYVWR